MPLPVFYRPGMKCLRHGEEASVCERGANESLLHTEVFEAVEETRVRHLHDAAAERVHLNMGSSNGHLQIIRILAEEEENDKVAHCRIGR